MSDPYLSVSGALARLRELDVVSNNLANSNTIGFKRDRGTFGVALEAHIDDLAGRPTEGEPGRVFTKTESIDIDFTAGPLTHTGRPLDAAILGEGFFVIGGEELPRYTRAGRFIVNANGELATLDGAPVRGGGQGAASIRSDGTVLDALGEEVGQLEVVRFEQPERLQKLGNNLFGAPADEEPLPSDARLSEGSVEASNTRPMEDLVAMVELQRAFDVIMRSLESDDRATRNLIQEFNR